MNMLSRTMKHGALTSLALLALTLAPACAPEESLEHTGDADQALNGTVVFPTGTGDECSPTERANILEAFALLLDEVVASSNIDACLAEAFLSPDNGDFAESIAARLREDMPTSVLCRNLTNANGSAQIDISYERITLDHGLALNPSVKRIASVILHEISHNKGYIHLDRNAPAAAIEGEISVPEQLESCIWHGEPKNRPRSEMTGEVELAPVGNDSGSPFSLWCDQDEVMVGQRIGTGPSSLPTIDVVTGLGVRCKRATGGSITTKSTGSGSFSTNDCPSGYVVIGAELHADAFDVVDSARFLCASVASVTSGSNVPTSMLPVRGTEIGTFATRICPPRMAVRALAGRAGAHIDELRLVCEEIAAPAFETPVDMSPVSVTAGMFPLTGREICSDRGAMVSLYGRERSNGVARLGGICAPLDRTGTTLAADTDASHRHTLPGVGDQGATEVGASCPSGQALVGIKAHPGSVGGIGKVSGICAPIGTWDAGGGGGTTTLAAFGGAPEPSVTRMCSVGKFLVGYEVAHSTYSTGRTVHSITPVCRDFHASSSSVPGPGPGL